MKWILVALLGLGSAGALAMALTADVHRDLTQRSAPAVSLRAFPAMSPSAEPAKAAEPEKAPEKAPEPVAEAESAPAKPAPGPAPVAVAEKPAPPPAQKPAPPPAQKPAPPPAEKPAPVAVAEKPAAAPPAEGMLNLRASDTADVYLDGKKLGGSPLLGIKARAGAHKVRFDCYDAAGNTIAGPAQTVTVKADAETDVEFPCPTE